MATEYNLKTFSHIYHYLAISYLTANNNSKNITIVLLKRYLIKSIRSGCYEFNVLFHVIAL